MSPEKVRYELVPTLNENEELIMVSSAESALIPLILQVSLTSKSKLLKHFTITLLFSLVRQIENRIKARKRFLRMSGSAQMWEACSCRPCFLAQRRCYKTKDLTDTTQCTICIKLSLHCVIMDKKSKQERLRI